MPDVAERAAQAGRRLRDELARPQLTVDLARLYSQHVRLRTGQDPLPTFTVDERDRRFFDTVRLVDAAFAARERGEPDWQAALRRAAEILEWLAHPETNPELLPLSLLGSACYQLAGYHARAASLARRASAEEDAPLLRLLLEGNYDELLDVAVSIASEPGTSRAPAAGDLGVSESSTLDDLVIREMASALGVIAAELRWGSGRRTADALEKLRAAASASLLISDAFEWLLVKLAAETAGAAVATSLRVPVTALSAGLGAAGKEVLERYVRLAYLNQQMAVWPSQARGLSRLGEGGSFALCTPTGSGKTRVAEVALLEGLFQRADTPDELLAPLCLYIVPTRSLAAEIEARFSRVLRRAVGARAVTVTGLYGGTDWGPSDEWLLTDEPTVLICTQEKCEALIRFFGSLFLPRLRLVIVDEAHEVQFSDTSDVLVHGESRALRLESVVARLRARLPETRFVAMSAVAHQLERTLARWISGDADADPVTSDYRSTRQLVGRLMCQSRGRTRIEYDVLDGQPLVVRGADEAAPYVPQPFLRHPPAPGFEGPTKGLAPFALWAAINLARSDGAGATPQSVLVSVIEGIANFAGWFVSLLDEHWGEEQLPQYFNEPTEGSSDKPLWDAAIAMTEDLFGEGSRELKLLRHGIVVHHGKMPGRLPRILVELVERRIVRVVLATSTLTQGVNLPFEAILIPGLTRQEGRISAAEFTNLIGRAGRPGVATEGQALVLMLEGLQGWQRQRADAAYRATLNEWMQGVSANVVGRSPLANLINLIWNNWEGTDSGEFEAWLETTAVDTQSDASPILSDSLGVLDTVVLAAIAESEGDVEGTLRRVWAESFARYASAEEARFERAFVARGRAISERFTDERERARVYRTALPPRDARELQAVAPRLIEHLQTGGDYWRWDSAERFAYVEGAVALVSDVDRFTIRERVGNSTATWRDVLRWWLDPIGAGRQPTIAQVGNWHAFIAREFTYRFTWGQSVILLADIPDELDAPADGWAGAGVPWAAAWMKDMLQWGTLEPVAAYVLAHQFAVTRDEATQTAADYYAQWGDDVLDDPLNPAAIRAWARTLSPALPLTQERTSIFPVDLMPDVEARRDFPRWRVVPVATEDHLLWVDVAGYPLAASSPGEAVSGMFDYVLNVQEATVEARPYLL